MARDCRCGIARMWATMFWSSQIAFSLGYLHIYMYRSGKMPMVLIGAVQKVAVGILLLKANHDDVVREPIAAAGVLDLVMACTMLFDIFLPPGQEVQVPVAVKEASKSEMTAGVLEPLRKFASQTWYPWVVGMLSGVNNFTVVLTAPLVVAYITGVLANPSRRYITAVANAFGTAAGLAVLIYQLDKNDNYIKEQFPQMFENKWWGYAQEKVDNYGAAGAVLYSCLPIIMQPLVAICVAAKMSPPILLGCIFVGRTIKYTIMAELAVRAPELLRFFGSTAAAAAKSYKVSAKTE